MDQPAGHFTWLHMRATDMLSVALRSLPSPSSAIACRMELTVPRSPYRAEFTSRKMFPARTVSFSIRSATLAKDTSSFARLAIKRFRIGEKGGSFPNATRALSFTFGAFTEAVTFFISAAPRENREYWSSEPAACQLLVPWDCLSMDSTYGFNIWIQHR